ncbi:MAG: universal stress protein [Kiritimatiellae bacterium]|nr:universal stress protein [Kiritimatiellia bacterium]MDD4735334.1 universal stress protein [Kiritimatiellia bacterium]
MQHILVGTDGSDYAKTACEYAFYFAGLAKARVTGIHVLDSRMLEGPVMVDNAGWIGAESFGTQLHLFREVTEKKGEVISEAFTKLAGSQGVKAPIRVCMGHPPTVLLDEESDADLVILGQRGEDAAWIGGMIGSTAERVARQSSKPCLVTPAVFKPVSRILSAYDGSDHSREALVMATEMAKANECELVMICVADGVSPEQNQRVADEGLALIQSYGMTANVITEDGDALERILATIAEYDCDLLVVGAYGHSRIREMILGSTTTQLISKSDIPVLLLR